MKTLNLVFIFLLCLQVQSYAQKVRSDGKIGVAYSQFTIEDISGISVYGEYSRVFAGPVDIGLNGSYGFIESTDSLPAGEKFITFSVGINGYYSIVHNDYQKLKIGAGINGRYFSDQWTLDSDRVINKSAFKPGLSLILNYDFFLNDVWILGAQARLQRFAKDNTVYLLGLHLAYKF